MACTISNSSLANDDRMLTSLFYLVRNFHLQTIMFTYSQAEVNLLGDVRHPNLVKLIGYCIEDDQRLLVYEFMQRGNLENHLFRSM